VKIVTWNCNGALRKKLEYIDSIGADVLIIQECEDPAKSTSIYREWAGNYLWVGISKNKGIGVFPKKEHVVSKLFWDKTFRILGINSDSKFLSWSTKDLQLFIPFTINNKYTVLGVWTKNVKGDQFDYIGQFWKFLQIHSNDLTGDNIILLGDFNSNSVWDKYGRWWNHTDVVNDLANMGIKSLYHSQYQEAQGQETIPTFYLYRNKNKPYHIDYVFLSKHLIQKSKLSIGSFDKWIRESDHMPLSATILDGPDGTTWERK